MSSLRKIFPAAALLACVLFLYSYIRFHLSDFTKLSGISPLYLAPIGCLCLAVLIVEGLVVRALTVGFDIDLGFIESLSIAIITSLGNIFTPRGGTGFKALYLRSRHDFEYSYFVSALTANYLIAFNIISLTALVCLAIFFIESGVFSLTAALVFPGMVVFTSWTMLAPAPGLNWIPVRKVREQAAKVLAGWQLIRKSRKTPRLYCLTLSILLLSAAANWLEFAAFHIKDTHGNGIGFLQAAIFSAIGCLSGIISVTPAALGIKEGLLMFCSHFLGITQSQALAVSLLDRSVNLVVLGLLFGFVSIYVKKKLKPGNGETAGD